MQTLLLFVLYRWNRYLYKTLGGLNHNHSLVFLSIKNQQLKLNYSSDKFRGIVSKISLVHPARQKFWSKNYSPRLFFRNQFFLISSSRKQFGSQNHHWKRFSNINPAKNFYLFLRIPWTWFITPWKNIPSDYN